MILGEVGDVRRFPSRHHFATYSGVAPIEVSSGKVQHHRLSRTGNRQLNHAMHIMALSNKRCIAWSSETRDADSWGSYTNRPA